MKTLKISFATIKALAAIICGNTPANSEKPISPYRTGNNLSEFFVEDLGLKMPDGFSGSSRTSWTEAWLKGYNGTSTLKVIIENSVRHSDYFSTDYRADEAVEYLNTYLEHDGLRLAAHGKKFVLVQTNGVNLPSDEKEIEILSEPYIKEMAGKCDAKISNGDYEGAITNARTLLEAVLVKLEETISGQRIDYKGELPKQFKAVSKLINLDPERADLDERFKDVIRGLVMIVHGLAPLRNKMSDGHARERIPTAHHAQVIVNATKTVSSFLVESFLFQKEKGQIKFQNDRQ